MTLSDNRESPKQQGEGPSSLCLLRHTQYVYLVDLYPHLELATRDLTNVLFTFLAFASQEGIWGGGNRYRGPHAIHFSRALRTWQLLLICPRMWYQKVAPLQPHWPADPPGGPLPAKGLCTFPPFRMFIPTPSASTYEVNFYSAKTYHFLVAALFTVGEN